MTDIVDRGSTCAVCCRHIQETIDKLEVPPEGSQPLKFDSVFAQSQWKQYRELLNRNFISYSRNPAYNGTRYAIPSG